MQMQPTDPNVLGLPAAALVTAVASVGVGVFTAVVLYIREYFTRKYDRRRTALLDVQDAAADLRQALRRYGRELYAKAEQIPTGQPRNLVIDFRVSEDERQDADARLDVRLSRLGRVKRDVAVQSAVEAWREVAAEHYSTRRPLASLEAEAWADINRLVRAALR
jgi:hypothetical protein